MEPIIIEDVPSSMTDEGMNPQFENSFSSTIPIIEDDESSIEIHDETSTKTLANTCAKIQPTQYLREPSYPEQLTFQKAMEQPSFNLLG